jgi:hypothetical protein
MHASIEDTTILVRVATTYEIRPVHTPVQAAQSAGYNTRHDAITHARAEAERMARRYGLTVHVETPGAYPFGLSLLTSEGVERYRVEAALWEWDRADVDASDDEPVCPTCGR